MARYNPPLFSTPLKLYPVTNDSVKGATVKHAAETGIPFFGSFKTYGGTEKNVNGVISVIDTATIETYFRPDIKSGCIVERLPDGARYEIIGEPENIEMRNQFLKFKVRRVKGGA